jgi:hypothetical protein
MSPLRIPLRKHTNEKPGYLVAFEPPDIGIEFKRVFYITGFKDNHTMRGFHGHYTTTQFLVCLHGTASVQAGSETFQLVDDSDGLLIPPNHFIVMDLSQDAILLVLCDTLYADDRIYTNPEYSTSTVLHE